jgi:hypothetical protein
MKTILFALALLAGAAQAQNRANDFAHMEHENGTTVLQFNKCTNDGKTYDNLWAARYVFHSGLTYSGCYRIDAKSLEVDLFWKENNQRFTYPMTAFTIKTSE